jgi:hypothetical protein
MHCAIHIRVRSDEMIPPFRSTVLICIAIILLSISAGPVSADSIPQITGISPTGGPIYGGTLVTITGSGFTGATNVTFGEKSGTALNLINDSILTVITPANPAGTVDVSVYSATGTRSTWKSTAVYMYEEVARPRVSGISPSSGPAAGGTTVTITGSGFSGTENVRFGEKYARDLTVTDDNHIRITTPESPPGLVTVSVKNSVGVGSSQGSSAMFLYEYPFPELTGISPSSGSTAGGTVVSITGSGLSGATEVQFGGIRGTGLTVIDDGWLTIISPPNPPGTVGISVINPDHTGNSAGAASVFRYDIPVPKLSNISPSSGPAAGGTVVTITGSGFTGAKSVTFGGKTVTDLTVIDDSHLRVISPASSPGSFPISITSAIGEGGSLGPSTMFRYEFSASTTTIQIPATPARGGDTSPAVSFPATSTAGTPVTPAPATTHSPGFEAGAGLSALGALILHRKTPPCT